MSTKSGVLIEPKIDQSTGTVKVVYETNPYDKATGLTRIVQKFAIILLTTKGTDKIRPWFGTYLPNLPRMNIADDDTLKLFIQDQVADARQQYFSFQTDDKDTLDSDDILTAVDLESVTIYQPNIVSIKLRFSRSTGSTSVSLTV